jgi:hypothetical protein
MSAVQPAVPRPIRRVGRLVALAALTVYAATTGGSMATDTMSYEVAKAIVEKGSVAMSGPVLALDAHRGVDGRYYSPYGLGHPLYGVPFYAAGRVAEIQLGFSVGRSDAVRKAAFVFGSAVATAGVVWLVYLFAWRLTGDARAAVVTAFVAAFATLLWPYAKYGFNAPLAALTVTGGVYGVWTGVRTGRTGVVAAAGAAFGAALLVRHELALAGAVAALWAAAEHRFAWRMVTRLWMALGVPMAAALAAMFVYNAVRFGNILDNGYLRDPTATFSPLASMWEGVAGLLVSPGRSLFLYSPILVAAVPALVALHRRDRSTARLLGGVSTALFLFYASLAYWDADRSYGPRYLLPIVPLLTVPLAAWFAPRWPRPLAWLVAASVLVQIPAVAMDFTKAGPALGVSHPLLERRWNWRVAGLTTNTRALVEFAPDNARYVLGLATPPPVRPAAGRDAGFSEQFGHSFDVWWLYLFYFGALSRLGMAAAVLALAGVAAAALARLNAELGSIPASR